MMVEYVLLQMFLTEFLDVLSLEFLVLYKEAKQVALFLLLLHQADLFL
jgi:hypothetical protein